MAKRLIINDFIHPEDSKDFIRFFDQNEHLIGDGRDFHADKTINWHLINDLKVRDLLKYYARKAIMFIDHHFHTKTTMYQNMRLVRWSKGMLMKPHIDKQHQYEDTMDYSSLMYLNDEYEGGEFQFVTYSKENCTIDTPKFNKTGSIIVFPSDMEHRVTPVTKGIRSSLVVWFLGPPFK